MTSHAGETAPPTPAIAACYEEMRRIARRLLVSAGDRLLFQPTELAHEAAIRMLMIDSTRFESNAHMLATAARITRRALLDEIRASHAVKRRPVLRTMWPEGEHDARLDELDEAIEALGAISPDHARIIELRFFLGMTVEETATAEGVSPRSIKRRWAAARAWLQERLDSGA
jgi:RNA polymerase sigma factor (TIGR02999 family)